jgi:hypothetical protein
MKFKLSLIILIATLTLNLKISKAQGTVTFTPSHLAAAEQLINATGMTDLRFSAMRGNTIKALSSNVPEKNREKFVKDITAFLDKYLPLSMFRDQTLKMYAGIFTEDELKQLISFYNSPLGKKITTKAPELIQNMMLMDQGVINDHRDELTSIVTESMKE